MPRIPPLPEQTQPNERLSVTERIWRDNAAVVGSQGPTHAQSRAIQNHLAHRSGSSSTRVSLENPCFSAYRRVRWERQWRASSRESGDNFTGNGVINDALFCLFFLLGSVVPIRVPSSPSARVLTRNKTLKNHLLQSGTKIMSICTKIGVPLMVPGWALENREILSMTNNLYSLLYCDWCFLETLS